MGLLDNLYPASLPLHLLFTQFAYLPFCLELWCVLSFIHYLIV